MLDTFYYIVDGFINTAGGRSQIILKTDRQGNIQQQALLEGPFQDIAISEGGRYVITSGSDILFVGELYDLTPGHENQQGFQAKISPELEIKWVQYYGDTAYNEVCNSVLEMSNGEYLILGSRAYLNGNTESWIIKTDTDGTVLWEKTLPDTFDHTISINMVSDGDGNAVFCAQTSDWSWADELSTALITKVDPDGNVLWHRKMKGVPTLVPIQSPLITALHDGGFALSWCKDTANFIPYSLPTLSGLNENGQTQWTIEWRDTTIRILYTLKTTANGDILGCGAYNSYNIFDSAWLLRVSPQGEIIWEHYYSDSLLRPWYIMEPYDITETPDGRIAITGIALDSTPIGPVNANVLLLVVDENGCLIEDCSEGYHLITEAAEPPEVEPRFGPHLWPNPADETLRVEWETPAGFFRIDRIDLYELTTGRLVMTQALDGNQQPLTLSVSRLSGGIFLAVLHGEDGRVAWKRFVVQH